MEDVGFIRFNCLVDRSVGKWDGTQSQFVLYALGVTNGLGCVRGGVSCGSSAVDSGSEWEGCGVVVECLFEWDAGGVGFGVCLWELYGVS